ncbi:MAG: hypothetical protein M3Q75_06760 [Gemmatimonadota bacterium]|nr:hypothetical protein [Gemmatimonadota bacterium]
MTEPGPILDPPAQLLTGGGGVDADTLFDVILGGTSFNLAVGVDRPHQRESPQSERDQVDQAPEAGENTLRSWWLRSQMSFHCGAGVDYLDTVLDYDPIQRARFRSSRGVDVWTPGKVFRLPGVTNIVGGSGIVLLAAAELGGVDKLVVASSSTLRIVNDPAGAASTAPVVWGGSSTILSLVTNGAKWYAATATDIYSGSLDGTPGAVLYTFAATTVVLGWAKERLMAGIGNKVYELGATGPTLPPVLYTHPSPTWTWTAVSESPTGILFAGYGGGGSSIYKFSISDDVVPVIAGGAVTATMPTGERITALFQYVGSLLGIGTDRGVRVGTFDTFYANLTYGPLTVECGRVRAFTGRDRFIYAATDLFEGASGLIRVDLGQPVDKAGGFAYATDLTAPSQGPVTAVVTLPSGRLVFGQSDVGALVEGAVPATTGEAWLETARIRFGTVEPKVFHFAQVQGAGPITVWAGTTHQALVQVFAITDINTSGKFTLGLPTRDEWIQLRFYLPTGASEMHSYQVQALPAADRAILIGLPLGCFDFEVDRHGTRHGYKGWAWERWQRLEALDRTRSVFQYRSPTLGGEMRQVAIERLSFNQSSSPNESGGFAGHIQVVLRTMD